MIALKHDDPITFLEGAPGVNVVYDAYALVSEMGRIIVEFEIVCGPDPRAFEANGCYFVSYYRIASREPGIRTLHELDFARLRDSQYNIELVHTVPLDAGCRDSKTILGTALLAFNYIYDPSQYNSDSRGACPLKPARLS